MTSGVGACGRPRGPSPSLPRNKRNASIGDAGDGGPEATRGRRPEACSLLSLREVREKRSRHTGRPAWPSPSSLRRHSRVDTGLLGGRQEGRRIHLGGRRSGAVPLRGHAFVVLVQIDADDLECDLPDAMRFCPAYNEPGGTEGFLSAHEGSGER